MPEEVLETSQIVEPKLKNWPKVVLAAVLGFALLFGAAYAGYWYGTESAEVKFQITEPPTLKPLPFSKETCEAAGGVWGRVGLSLNEKCNLPTSDAGKECSSSSDCQGSCIAELSQEEWDRAAKGIVYTNGKCSAWKIVVGCRAFVEGGKVEGILCID